jgi:hypothetical protein
VRVRPDAAARSGGTDPIYGSIPQVPADALDICEHEVPRRGKIADMWPSTSVPGKVAKLREQQSTGVERI